VVCLYDRRNDFHDLYRRPGELPSERDRKAVHGRLRGRVHGRRNEGHVPEPRSEQAIVQVLVPPRGCFAVNPPVRERVLAEIVGAHSPNRRINGALAGRSVESWYIGHSAAIQATTAGRSIFQGVAPSRALP